jgi:hypothetical protein
MDGPDSIQTSGLRGTSQTLHHVLFEPQIKEVANDSSTCPLQCTTMISSGLRVFGDIISSALYVVNLPNYVKCQKTSEFKKGPTSLDLTVMRDPDSGQLDHVRLTFDLEEHFPPKYFGHNLF